MNWSNVKLILHREVRDQLRDRRTLFMIAVLPLLLYPLLGMSMFQVMQFVSEHPTHVLVIGTETLPASPKLIDGHHFDEAWFTSADRTGLLELSFLGEGRAPAPSSEAFEEAKAAVERGDYEAIVYFPPDFGQRLAGFQASLTKRLKPKTDEHSKLSVPSPEIYYNTAKEKSQITFARVSTVLNRWTDEIGRQNLAQSNLPESAAHPFKLEEHDVAVKLGRRDAAVWSKVLPFLLLIWALTGAFYPAIDLCAGEKERGTLETLLSSPAERVEIVWGKLLTVMLFSVMTSLLNLLSVGVTGTFVVRALPQELKHIGAPPPLTPLWLGLALVPMSALFSALCLALASFARSSKEGQYYLMPLLMVTMPLVVLPMAPGVELNLGNSLIPVTGVVLLLRALLEGNLAQALPFVPSVVVVTLGCCLWATRWAVDQFNSESVLFRESERFDLSLWFKHLLRDRGDTPSPAAALLCGLLILMIFFFMGLTLKIEPGSEFKPLAQLVLVTQLAMIASPALLMTIMLTRSPRRTLLLRLPKLWTLPAAFLLAVAVHPAILVFGEIVQRLYPMSDSMRQAMHLHLEADLWQILAVFAFTPAICEELAFRGFMLSGLRHLGHKWQAILISSIFFGVTHQVFHQSIVACVMGLVLGYLAVQTGSVLTCVVFHFTSNAMQFVISYLLESPAATQPPWSMLIEKGGNVAGYAFAWPVTVVGCLVAAVLLYCFHRLPYARTSEEALQDALDHQRQASPAAAGS
ncbi:MAG TPA: ABC transporter permease subunit/CPBP intramembrane protease [Pirellulales bacterium]|nr:ABC transporter permease subunit/CPBP intramembrane protease [Pirellulales bacterium]